MKNSIPKRLHAPLLGLLVLSILLMGGCKETPHSPKPAPSPKPEKATTTEHLAVIADSAMVVSAHPLASQIGIDIMKQGGNAADAAVAVHFALAVCFPYAGNIGGGGFLLIREANGAANALDFREMAPMAAHRDMFLDARGNVVPLSEKGHRAAGVPGSVDGMVTLHTRYGRLPWAKLIQPSIDLARKGFAATANEAKWLNDQAADFKQYNPCHEAYLLRDQGWHAGDSIVQEDLAQTLERIRDEGRAGFYSGKSAEFLLAEMQCGRGIITQADLDGYQSIWRTPLKGTYKGHGILTMPPPSSGGIVLLQMLAMVAAHPLAKWGPDDARTIHLMVEAERRAFADRAEFMADPDFVQVPVAGLLDSAYLRARMADFDPAHATPSSKIGHGAPRFEPIETTHFSIIDPAGNAISLTTTLNSPYGCKVWVAGAGYLLNNEMDDFSAKPGVPNIFGLVGNEANAIAPRKRMLSSMTPTIVDKGGKVYLVLGTPGGATITTSVFQVILDVIDHGMSLQEAVDRKRFHHQWLPDEVAIEDSAFTLAAWQALRALGHNVCVREPIGRVDAIRIREDGKLEGAADHRRDDAAAGW